MPGRNVSSVDPLHAYVARSCPVKVQHRFAPPSVAPRELPLMEPFLQAGIEHELMINAEHAALVGVTEVESGVEATLKALETGVSVFKNGMLPTDNVGR